MKNRNGDIHRALTKSAEPGVRLIGMQFGAELDPLYSGKRYLAGAALD